MKRLYCGHLTALAAECHGLRWSQHRAAQASACTAHGVLLLPWQCGDVYLDIRVGVGPRAVPDEHGVALREVTRSLCCGLHLRVQKAVSALATPGYEW